MRARTMLFGLITLIFAQGCQTMPPIQTVDYVDLERFMARDPSISSDDYHRILEFLEGQGYDIAKVQKVPQK